MDRSEDSCRPFADPYEPVIVGRILPADGSGLVRERAHDRAVPTWSDLSMNGIGPADRHIQLPGRRRRVARQIRFARKRTELRHGCIWFNHQVTAGASRRSDGDGITTSMAHSKLAAT